MLQFTKEIKEKWLNDLKENGHLKGRSRLKSKEGKYCCLGRLCEVLQLEITEDGDNVKNYDTDGDYTLFNNLFGKEKVNRIWNANDGSYLDNYDSVIPLIEQLPTVD